MKSSGIKGFIIGFILCGILFGSAYAVMAIGTTTSLDGVMVGGVKIVVDGKELYPTDVNGKAVDPMIYEGTTYLPVRAVATAMGKAVYWDGPNFTVYLGNMDGTLEYPTVMLTDMTSIFSKPNSSNELTDNYGNTYGSAIYASDSTRLEYLLNMKYTHLKGTLYIAEGTSSSGSGYMTVTADGKQLYTSPALIKTSTPVPFDINVTGYNDVNIEFSTTDRWLNLRLADAGFYQ